MFIGKYFTLEEMCYTSHKEIVNTPSEAVVEKLTDLVKYVLDPVREKWGRPIGITSAYRSKKLNTQVGGAINSQHMAGEACDINTGSMKLNRELYALIQSMVKSKLIEVDQCILEKGGQWIHLSFRKGKNRNQFLELG